MAVLAAPSPAKAASRASDMLGDDLKKRKGADR
jgi:hypothetical protein